MMEYRILKKGDYELILTKWWKSWRWTPPPKDMLPEDGCGGVIVSSNGIDVCAGFIYFTNSKTAWLEYIVSSIDYKESDRAEAIEFLINSLSTIARDMGVVYIYTSLKSKTLIDRYVNCGFIKGDSNCQELIKVWQE
jgi:hypothetical protein